MNRKFFEHFFVLLRTSSKLNQLSYQSSTQRAIFVLSIFKSIRMHDLYKDSHDVIYLIFCCCFFICLYLCLGDGGMRLLTFKRAFRVPTWVFCLLGLEQFNSIQFNLFLSNNFMVYEVLYTICTNIYNIHGTRELLHRLWRTYFFIYFI